MNISKYNQITFYQNLGKLFYAIAAIDNNVRDEEFFKLQEIVKSDSLIITANHKTEAKNTIINTFNWLHNDNEYDAKTCYNSFIDFKKNNEELFTDKVKLKIYENGRFNCNKLFWT